MNCSYQSFLIYKKFCIRPKAISYGNSNTKKIKICVLCIAVKTFRNRFKFSFNFLKLLEKSMQKIIFLELGSLEIQVKSYLLLRLSFSNTSINRKINYNNSTFCLLYYFIEYLFHKRKLYQN